MQIICHPLKCCLVIIISSNSFLLLVLCCCVLDLVAHSGCQLCMSAASTYHYRLAENVLYVIIVHLMCLCVGHTLLLP